MLALLCDHLVPRLIGLDAARVEAVWRDLYASTRATAVGAITSLALAAVDTAPWDLRAKAAGLPLWVLAGGAKERIPLYDTEGGWLQFSTEELVAGAKASQAAGWPGVKLKVGKLRAVTRSEIAVADGHALAPTGPGLGIDWDRDAIEDRRVA